MSSTRFLRFGIVVVAAVLAGAIGFAFAGAGIDAVDEALIEAPPAEVYEALIAEAAGRTSWWAPYWRAAVRGDGAPDRVGSIMDITVQLPGAKRVVRMVGRTEEAVPGRLIRIEYIDGDYVGEVVLTLEPEGGGTRVRVRFDTQPTRWTLRLLSPIVRKGHSAVMRAGFTGLAEHLRRATPAVR